MSRDMRVNYNLFDCISAIEKVDKEIYRLQLLRDKLVERRDNLKRELEQVEFDTYDPSSAYLKQKMAMDLLNEKLAEK